MEQMKKAVFFDIDGTLWNERMEIPESTAVALQKLKENGCYTFICTGRSRSNVRAPKLLELGFDGIVAACGTHIDFRGETIFTELLKPHQVEHALKVMRRYGISVVLEGPAYIYVDDKDFPDDPYVVYLRKELGDDVKPITGTKEFEINKMSAVLNGADYERVCEELGAAFDVIRHGEELIEIGPAGHSKATGIQKVCEHYAIAKENTYAFGDSANDIDMLKFVSHGIAMGNGTDEVKEAAEYVTTDIMENGIQNGLKYYGLI